MISGIKTMGNSGSIVCSLSIKTLKALFKVSGMPIKTAQLAELF